MHIRLGAKVIGQAEALRVLHGLSGRQMAVASAKALNDVGFEVRRAMQDEMRAVFKDPTDYILRSPRFKRATPERLSVTIEPAYMGRAKGKGGDGVDPQKILNAQAWVAGVVTSAARWHCAARASCPMATKLLSLTKNTVVHSLGAMMVRAT